VTVNATIAGFLEWRESCIRTAPDDSGLALCHSLVAALDAALRSAFPAHSGEFALVAIGGYGRRELCLYSDIDLMLLYRGWLPPGIVDTVFYPLWDAGLKVGHAVRTVPEAVKSADERLETLTSLLDHRLVAGSPELVDRLSKDLAKLLKRRLPRVREELRTAERQRRNSERFQLLETDLKGGRGGLRTLQRERWLRRAEALAGVPQAAESCSDAVDAAHEVLLRSRNALHAAAGRASDTWLFDLQEPACRWLGSDVDVWAPLLYGALRDIDHAAEEFWEVTAPVKGEKSSGRLSGLVPRRRNALSVEREPPVAGQSVFAYAAGISPLDISPPRLPAVAATAIGGAPGPSWTAEDRQGLVSLLRSGERGYRIFDALDRLGWIERALPEWRHVRGAPQHVPFHENPVDTHLWRTVIEAIALAEGRTDDPWAAGIAIDLGGLDELLLASLLHDIGKGWPGDHAETGAAAATAFCQRAHFGLEATLTVATSVRHHLLLPTIATRRDIADARVIEDVADRAGRARTLRILYLLSVADSRATGPTVWNPWKASLIRSLFAAALEVLEMRAGASPLSTSRAAARSMVLEAAEGRVAHAAVAAHIDGMAPGYLQSFGAADVIRHIELIDKTSKSDAARLDVRGEGDAYDLVVTTPDRPGLIAMVSGVLALHNLSVLDGRFFTREDGVALQALHVVDALGNAVTEDRWRRVQTDLERALRGDLPLEQRLREKIHAYRGRRRRAQEAEVRFVREASDEYTVVEVHAADRVGLLYAIAGTLFALCLDIHLAKIDTQGTSVVDVFYLRDLTGAPLRDAAKLEELRMGLLAAVES
jgi:[protein-PII] uridylyltransferase